MNFRKGLQLKSASAALDITPLIDVVFILLIFLLVSTTFKSREQAFSIVLPVGDQSSRIVKVDRATVYVTRLGQYVLYAPGESAGEPVEGESFLTLNDLSAALARVAATPAAQAGINIKGDAQADYQRILDVVNECRRHGVEQVFFPYKMGERNR